MLHWLTARREEKSRLPRERREPDLHFSLYSFIRGNVPGAVFNEEKKGKSHLLFD